MGKKNMRALLGGVAIGAILAGAGVYYLTSGATMSDMDDHFPQETAADGAAGHAPAGEPTVEEAERFLAEAESEMREFGEFAARTAWVQNNFITYDTNWLLERMSAESTEMAVNLATETARYSDLDLPETMARKMNMLRARHHPARAERQRRGPAPVRADHAHGRGLFGRPDGDRRRDGRSQRA